MTDQDLWFEPVSLLSRCSLNEALLWVWADRVPVSNVYREKNVFECLQDWECQSLDIPPIPEGIRHGAQYLTEERLRKREYKTMPLDARNYHIAKGLAEAAAIKEWLPQVSSAMEVSATELFLKLRRGQIEAQGKRLPPGTEIIDFLQDQNSYSGGDYSDLTDEVIPANFWTVSGIDWISNAVTAHKDCYCDVSLPVETLMNLFPGEREPVHLAEFVGVCVHVKGSADDTRQAPIRPLGRPPTFAWEAFHVEVAEMIRDDRMPQKKEAAIQELMNWFESTQGGKRPSRSAISEKLTPYYRRFFGAKE